MVGSRHLTGHLLRFASGACHFRAPCEPFRSIRRSAPNNDAAPRYRYRPPPLGFYPQVLPHHPVDLGDICRDLLIAATLTGDWLEAAMRECLGRVCTAKMDYRGKVPLLLRAGCRLWRARENRCDFSVQKHRRKLDSAAREDPGIEPVRADDFIRSAGYSLAAARRSSTTAMVRERTPVRAWKTKRPAPEWWYFGAKFSENPVRWTPNMRQPKPRLKV
jgi:hypothetical protein